MRVAITGAGGFVGRSLVDRVLSDPRIDHVNAFDRLEWSAPRHERVTAVIGELSDPGMIEAVVADVDVVVHLASVLGGSAEAAPEAARRINVDCSLAIMEQLARKGSDKRFVFASSIAALGNALPDPVTDGVEPRPVMTYGAHKAMIEVAVRHAAGTGRLDAIALRPSGVVARDGLDAGLKSAFLSRLFWSVRRGQDIVLPVARDSRTWLASIRNVAGNFAHAALVPDLGPERVLTLPALSLTFGALADALARSFPTSRSHVHFSPEARAVEMFGSFPALRTPAADAAGFTRDVDVDSLVRDAMTNGDAS